MVWKFPYFAVANRPTLHPFNPHNMLVIRILTMVFCLGIGGKAAIAQHKLPSPVELYEAVVATGFRNPMVIYKIAMWESAHLRSKIAREKANLFGLRARSSYLSFRSWRHCLEYMKTLEERRYAAYPYKEKNDYYDFIAWWGYKTGRSYDPREQGYIKTIEKMPPPRQ
jgi:hypothetical protein